MILHMIILNGDIKFTKTIMLFPHNLSHFISQDLTFILYSTQNALGTFLVQL